MRRMEIMSTRETILKLTGRRYLPVNIPGLGPLTVRSLSELERAKVEDVSQKDRQRLKRTILIQSLVDSETKQPVLTDADFDLLGEVDGAIVDEIVSVSMKLNQISEDDVISLLGKPVAK